MITKTAAFQTSDNKTHLTLEDAQRHELGLIFPDSAFPPPTVDTILKHRERIVDLLTTTPSSKTRARRVNGGSKKRTPKPTTDNAAINRELQDAKQ